MEYPVRGGSNLVLIDEQDGHELLRVPAPAGVELADPAWVDSTIYCLAVNDGGYSIWCLNGRAWTCVLEPTLQEIENLEGENHVLDFVSDRNGVKELYRYDPATGRAWQLTNSRYGGTDYFWHDGVLWFNSITPEGSAIFKATPPEPVEVDIREVHKYRVAEKLAEQERALLAEIPDQARNDVAVSAPKTYHKVPHLVIFHSWAPLYFDYDAIASMSGDLSYDTASPGLIGLFQNDLGTAWGTVGYSAHPRNGGIPATSSSPTPACIPSWRRGSTCMTRAPANTVSSAACTKTKSATPRPARTSAARSGPATSPPTSRSGTPGAASSADGCPR